MWGTWLFFFVLFNPLPPATSYFDFIEPIPLRENCKGVNIIEWHGKKEDEAVEIANETCNLAVLNFTKFLDAKKIKHDNSLNLSANLSILGPGFKPKEMNDSKRFTYGVTPKDSEGNILIAHGYYNLDLKQIFIMNIVFFNKKPNKFFKNVLAHEVFHALIHQNNVKMSIAEEEVLAAQFSRFLGLW